MKKEKRKVTSDDTPARSIALTAVGRTSSSSTVVHRCPGQGLCRADVRQGLRSSHSHYLRYNLSVNSYSLNLDDSKTRVLTTCSHKYTRCGRFYRNTICSYIRSSTHGYEFTRDDGRVADSGELSTELLLFVVCCRRTTSVLVLFHNDKASELGNRPGSRTYRRNSLPPTVVIQTGNPSRNTSAFRTLVR